MAPLINAEKIAYWYFRLNGFMTMQNFVVHDSSAAGLSQKTDADIYGVRFPFRSELDMPDDGDFRQTPKRFFAIAEVKSGECKLNGPWTNPDKQNMHYVLKSIGACEPNTIDSVAKNLYTNYVHEDENQRIQLFAIGSRPNQDYAISGPAPRQLLFQNILTFIFDRFHQFRMQKRDHQQWDSEGKFLYKNAEEAKEDFIALVSKEAGIKISDG
jgi:hypothetical protein